MICGIAVLVLFLGLMLWVFADRCCYFIGFLVVYGQLWLRFVRDIF